MSELEQSRERIGCAWSELQERWSNSREQWPDSVGYRFEREWWEQIKEAVPRFLEAMTEVNEVLERALQDTQE